MIYNHDKFFPPLSWFKSDLTYGHVYLYFFYGLMKITAMSTKVKSGFHVWVTTADKMKFITKSKIKVKEFQYLSVENALVLVWSWFDLIISIWNQWINQVFFSLLCIVFLVNHLCTVLHDALAFQSLVLPNGLHYIRHVSIYIRHIHLLAWGSSQVSIVVETIQVREFPNSQYQMIHFRVSICNISTS